MMADETGLAIDNQNTSPQITQGAVAFLDILGFKGMWQSRNIKSIINQVSTFHKSIDTYYKNAIESNKINPEFDIYPENLVINLISDTFVVSFEHGNPLIALAMVSEITASLISSYALKKPETIDDAMPIFLRGAISYGEFYRTENMYIGQAIDDAAEWFDKPEFIGAILTPRTGCLLKTFENFNSKLIFDCSVKTKIGEVNLFCIDWASFARDAHSTHDVLKSLYGAFIFGNKTIGLAHFEKYQNTERFVKRCLDRNT